MPLPSLPKGPVELPKASPVPPKRKLVYGDLEHLPHDTFNYLMNIPAFENAYDSYIDDEEISIDYQHDYMMTGNDEYLYWSGFYHTRALQSYYQALGIARQHLI